jgi:hypothetical protein
MRSLVADGRDGLQIKKVAANILKSNCGQPTVGGISSMEGETAPHRKSLRNAFKWHVLRTDHMRFEMPTEVKMSMLVFM